MEEKRLAFVVGEDKVEALRVVANGLGCIEDDMIYDEYKAAIEDRDSYRNRLKEAGEKFIELESKINLNAIQELEVCKADKENLLKSLSDVKNIFSETETKASLIMSNMLQFIQDECGENMIALLLEKHVEAVDLEAFGLEEWTKKEKKYKVVEIDVTMKKCSRIQVVVPSDYTEDDVDSFLEEHCYDGLEAACDSEDVDEWEFSPYIDNNSEETKEEIDRHYDKNELFPGSSDVSNELF